MAGRLPIYKTVLVGEGGVGKTSITIRYTENRFDDEILIALAAYNGGPGNTLRWLELGGEDLDLFVEVITATQSRRYLQKVYEQYHILENLYRSVGKDRQ